MGFSGSYNVGAEMRAEVTNAQIGGNIERGGKNSKRTDESLRSSI